jgi:hypothetical protein
VRIEFMYVREPGYFQDPRLVATGRSSTPRYIFAAVICMAGVLAIGVRDTPGGVVTGACLVAAGLLLVVLTRRASRDSVAVPAGATSPRRWVITEHGLTSSTEVTSAEYRWPAFRRLIVWPHAYLLRTGEGIIIDVPRQPLTPDEDIALRAVLRSHGLLRGPAGRQ